MLRLRTLEEELLELVAVAERNNFICKTFRTCGSSSVAINTQVMGTNILIRVHGIIIQSMLLHGCSYTGLYTVIYKLLYLW